MLRQFHYIDQNGKDQGVNVRNRSKELSELLSDVDRIRAERKKARNNRNKFGGVEGGAMNSGLSSASRYGGFGSEDAGGYGAYSGGVYGDGGGYGGNSSGFQDSSSRRDQFEEYDEFDEGAVAASGRRKAETSSTAVKREPKRVEPPKKKEPEVDMLGFDDDIPPETPPKPFASNGKKAASNPMDDILGGTTSGAAGDDDFDDFQSATPTTQTSAPSKPSIPNLLPPISAMPPVPSTQFAAPKPVSASQGANLNDLVGFNSISPAPSMSSTKSAPPPTSAFTSPPTTQQQPQAPKLTNYQPAQPNYFTSVPIAPTPSQPSSSMGMPGQQKPSLQSSTSFGGSTNPVAPKSAASGQDVFGNLWSQASAGAGIKKTSTPGQQEGPNLASMAKEKASAGIWGGGSGSAGQGSSGQRPAQGSGGLGDLLG